MFSIVFVCTGNTCRSPMAEELGRRYFAPLGDDVEVASAGLSATSGTPAAAEAVVVVGGMGGDLRQHRSRPVTPELMRRADIVLTMTQDHREELRRRYPTEAERIHTLAEFSALEAARDVADPIGKGSRAYERTYLQIEEYVRAALPRVKDRIRTGRRGPTDTSPSGSHS